MADRDPDLFPLFYPGFHGLSRVSPAQLDYLIRKLPMTGRFLEIGSASGVTAALIADARPELSIVCIDMFYGMLQPENLAEEGDRLTNWRANKRPNMHLWYGTPWGLVAILQPASAFNAILVDADHGYQPTLDCLRAAASLLVCGGMILAHDWDDPNWPEVAPAGEQFCRESGYSVSDSFSSLRVLRR